jgi:hypothetical protein
MSKFLAADPHKSDANAVNTNKKGFCLSISGNKTIKSWKISFFGIRLILETNKKLS